MNDKILPEASEQDSVQVLLLADAGTPDKYINQITQTSAALIAAAREDRMAVMVCTHADSSKQSVVLCVTYPSPDGKHVSYAPVAQLFDEEWAPWQTMSPPACALPHES